MRKMEEKHFSEHNDEHVEFLPVEWRSKLSLDGGEQVFLRQGMFLLVYLILFFKCELFTCVVGNPVHSTVFLFTLMIKVDEAYLKH